MNTFKVNKKQHFAMFFVVLLLFSWLLGNCHFNQFPVRSWRHAWVDRMIYKYA